MLPMHFNGWPFRSIAMPLEIDHVLARLKGVRRSGSGWTARCPAHDDNRPSLKIDVRPDGGILLRCHAGCSFDAIRAKLDDAASHTVSVKLPPRSMENGRLVKTYPYCDENGVLLYEKLRFEPKRFQWRRPTEGGGYRYSLGDVRRVPYGLASIQTAVASKVTAVFYCEGEKAVDALGRIGAAAFTFGTGAAAALPRGAADFLRGAAGVVVLPDNDDVGRVHARRAAHAFAQAGLSVKILALPNVPLHGDAHDWCEAGGSPASLRELIRTTAPYSLEPDESALPNDESAASDEVDDESIAEPRKAPAGDAPRMPLLLRDLLAQPELLVPPVAMIPRLAYPGRVTLLAAREKQGKSTLLAQAIAAFTSGADFLGDVLEPETALWYGIDEGMPDVVQRFQRYGADPARLWIHTAPPSASEFAKHLEHTSARVAVIDTLAELWGGELDESDAVQVRNLLRPYVLAARARDVGLILLHHTRKAGDEYRGSVQIGAAVDLILTLRSPSAAVPANEAASEPALDDGRRVLDGRGRASIVVRERLAFDGMRYRLGDAPLPPRARILRLLADEPMSANAVATALGVRKETVLDELHALRRDALVKQPGVRAPWELTDAGKLSAPGSALTPPNRAGTDREPIAREARATAGHAGTAGNHTGTDREPMREPLGVSSVPGKTPRDISGTDRGPIVGTGRYEYVPGSPEETAYLERRLAQGLT
jgi:putative DNA primase/helicase